jgi:hypothetical protein
MIHIALLFAIQFANPLNAIHHVLNLKMQFAMLNVKNLNAKLNALIKDAKCSIALSVLLYASNLIVLPTVKRPNPNANLSAKNLNVTGNVINLNVLNLNVSLFAKILIAYPKLNAAHVQWEHPEYLNLSHSSKKLKKTKIVVNANIKYF